MMNKRRFTMYTKQPKKMIIINILDILKRYTDENHRLSQREIMDILEREYDMKVDRKAVKMQIMLKRNASSATAELLFHF